jgi:hypothetical protein
MIVHRSEFIKSLREQFPAVEPWLKGYRDNLTFEMMRFRHFTEDAIARGDYDLVRRCFQFLNSAFTGGNRHVRNAVVVSFLEHLDFTGPTGAEAEHLMPAALADARREVMAQWTELEKRPAKRRRAEGAT